VLPKQLPTRRWAGYRSSRKWDGCELRIYAHEIGDEFDFADGRRIRLHRACTEAWNWTPMGLSCDGPAPKN